MKKEAKYPLKVQAIRSRGQKARMYVYFPIPLAAAIGLSAGETVEWELLDRSELHLARQRAPLPTSARKGKHCQQMKQSSETSSSDI